MASKLPQSFISKKACILQALSVPEAEYDDLSPKGSIDVGILDLISEINALEGCVTTSSCAGRISIFLEGHKRKDGESVDGERENEQVEGTRAGVGGKGGGGRWLFVTHDPVEGLMEERWMEGLGMSEGYEEKLEVGTGARLVHFKFEPMILHVLTASLNDAQTILSAALQAGFRESGALNLLPSGSEPTTPMVGIRSMGLALESLIGFEDDGKVHSIVPEWQLRHLLEISNERFVENTKRIERFRASLKQATPAGGREKKGENGEWEDKEARRERKRAEGLKRAEELRILSEVKQTEVMPGLDSLEQNL